MRWTLIALVGGLALGCGDSESDDEESVDTLTCAWLEGNNCWKTMLSGAVTCLPAEGDTGVLAADGSSCMYASGHIVTFEEPLVLPVPDENYYFRFNVTANGQQCLRYVETERTMTVTVGGDQTFEQTSNGLGLRFTCPDGSSVSNDNAFDLLECREDLLAAIALMPGYSYGSGNTSIGFGLLGYSEEQALSIFSCSR
jgi:hypothetical protein